MSKGVVFGKIATELAKPRELNRLKTLPSELFETIDLDLHLIFFTHKMPVPIEIQRFGMADRYRNRVRFALESPHKCVEVLPFLQARKSEIVFNRDSIAFDRLFPLSTLVGEF